MSENEKEVKRCLKTCYKEDKKIMLDESMFRIKGIMLYVYDLIYFGNKIVLALSTLEKVKRDKNRITYKTYSDNCLYLVKSKESDAYENYVIVDIGEYGKSIVERIERFLKENPDIIYFLSNVKMYKELEKRGITTSRIKLFGLDTEILAICKNKELKYDTLGFIYRESEKMYFRSRSEDIVIKAFNENGFEKQEKKGKAIEVNVGDIILVRNNKNTKYTFNLYKIISNHSRHFAIHIIWTDLVKGDKTNFYVKRLEGVYQRIISDNA